MSIRRFHPSRNLRVIRSSKDSEGQPATGHPAMAYCMVCSLFIHNEKRLE
ncbi:hypothetical protein ECP03052934_0779 [Escherichia coli p0305293.4]|nr:hypothetical protein ECP03052934_0779 [Escherichia coli p0305293.4]